MEWDWSKLPEQEHGTLIAHVEAGKWGEVSKLCEQHNISIWCCCNPEGLQNWTRWAIEKGIVKNGQSKGAGMAANAGGDGSTVVEQPA